MKKRLAVFVSGGGSNFQAVIDGVKGGGIPAEIVLCISSQEKAYALRRAAENGIPAYVMPRAGYQTKEEQFAAIAEKVEESRADYIILAGYMTVLPASFVQKYTDRIINIHPSLIPKYCGEGFYGLRVHEAVLKGGDTESGATVHFVDEGVDTGKMILQRAVPVLPGDTPETLQARILETEHVIICEAVKKLCQETME